MGRGWVHGVRVAAAAKKGKLFTKIAKEITVSVKMGGGANPDTNARLRAALKDAREQSMPKDTIDRAIKRGLGGGDEANYDEVTYEGYAPHGVAVLVEALTDNRNRTIQDLRTLFNKNGGNLQESGSVQWMFERIGSVIAKPQSAGVDPEEAAIMAGANEVQSLDDGSFQFIAAATDLYSVETELEKNAWTILKAELSYKAKTPAELNPAQETELREFLDAIDDCDDVKRVHLSL